MILPIVLVLLAASVATSYYYYRVTGNPFRMTYQVDADTYAAAPFFLWQTPPPRTYITTKSYVILRLGTGSVQDESYFQWLSAPVFAEIIFLVAVLSGSASYPAAIGVAVGYSSAKNAIARSYMRRYDRGIVGRNLEQSPTISLPQPVRSTWY